MTDSEKTGYRYAILAPNAIPQGFVDGKVVTEKVLTALQLDANEYRMGHTKVFFRAGVLGMLEDMRDERLSSIISLFQAQIRGYLIRKNYQKLIDQRYIAIKDQWSCNCAVSYGHTEYRLTAGPYV